MVEDTTRWHIKAACRLLGHTQPTFLIDAVCDCDRLVRDVILQRKTYRPAKVFNDYVERLPQWATDVVEAHSPTEVSSTEDIAQGYNTLFAKQLQHPEVFFLDDATSPCKRHGTRQPVLQASQLAREAGNNHSDVHVWVGTVPCIGWSPRNTATVRKGASHWTVPITNTFVANTGYVVKRGVGCEARVG